MPTKLTCRSSGLASPVINGRYQLVRPLGEGASATVFECLDLQHGGTPRALKLLRAKTDEALLRSEFTRLSGWSHPHLARVHDLDRLRAPAALGEQVLTSGLFLVMDLIRGEDPLTVMERTPPQARDARLRRIAADLSRALAFLHGHRVVHHDVKPQNLALAEGDGRAVLLDLGLATRVGVEGARGTVAYLAPEALAGAADFRSDLWSLGATLFHLAEGRPPFDGRGPALVRRILEDDPHLQEPWISPDLRDLINSLLRKDPDQRPSTARWVLAELSRSEGDHRAVAELSSRAELLPPALIGRAEIVSALEAAVAGPQPRLVVLAGPPGAGKSRAVEEVARRWRLRAAAGRAEPIRIFRGELREVLGELRAFEMSPALSRWLDGAALQGSVDELVLQVADFLEGLTGRPRPVLHLPRVELDSLTARLLQAMALATPDPSASGGALVLAEAGSEAVRLLTGPGSLVVELGPLDAAEVEALVASMLGQPPPDGLATRVADLSRGNPALITELVRQWHELGDEGLGEVRPELAALLAGSRSRLPVELREVMDALAVWGQPASAAELAELVDQDEVEVWLRLEALARRGTLVLDEGSARFASPAQALTWAGLLVEAEARPLHARASRRLGDDAPLPRRAWHLLRAGAEGAVEAALGAARELSACQSPVEAVRLLEQVVAGGARQAAPARTLLAELYLQTGRYPEALALLDGDEPGQLLLRAQVLQRAGDRAGAEALLRRLIPRLEDGERRLQASATLARVVLQSGRPSDASASLQTELQGVLAAPVDQALSPGAAACLEVAGFALLQQGQLGEAEQLFARGEQGLQSGNPSRLARFVDFRGMVAFAGGDLPLAAAHYRRALALTDQAGDAHGRATYLCNLGSTLLLTGRYGEALTRLTAALHDLERLARNTEVASSYCNLANLLLALGDPDQAARVCERGLELAVRLGSRSTQAHLLMLEGDVWRRCGKSDQALRCYHDAGALFEEAGAVREGLLCELSRAETLAEAGRVADAGEVLTGLHPAADQEGPVAVSWTRVGLCAAAQQPRSEPGIQLPEGLERTLACHCAALERQGAAPELWRAAALLGRLFLLRGRPVPARRALRRARATWEGIMSQAPDLYRERIREEPEAEALARSWDALQGGDDEPGESSSNPELALLLDPQRLRRLLAINKRLNSELRLPRLLDLIMDTVIELTGAERGFLLLVEEDGSLSVKVARNIDQRSLDGEELSLSRSIAERACRSGVPVVTVDAAADGRFQEALSVSDLHLRSVLAVPLRVKGTTVGTIYVDSRLRQGLFGEAEERLVQDLADQAAIAIDTARLLGENRRRQREIERLNQKLRRKVQHQQAELDGVREELRSSREILEQRKDYLGIVGRSARMRELFHLLDRVVETELPVVVQGESGTGKELIARAIHHNGRRAPHPFVSENCAAIPETLLESVLFGHVRGAFTGADRDRKGLFEVASGGTLFLDEIGDMSAAMQTKLLRVLQDGEFRRVGGAQTLHTDVRIIAATNKDLGQLVASGRFREDLFYRLNVILVVAPPLRERREDIPLLVDHFLGKHDLRESRRMSPEAMALLVGYAWPGNVRELENEVLRVAALAGQVIQPRDLSPRVAGSVPLHMMDADEMNLKARVEHLEQELLRRVLEQTGGNQTQAARHLGLSRFGLLKKLRRYDMGATALGTRKGL